MGDVLRAVFGGWSAEPVPVLASLVAAILYGLGSRRLAVAGSSLVPSRRQQACFGAGVAVILTALVSPVDRLALGLQWVHMLQHVLLLVVGAPLVVLGRPWETAAAALQPGPRAMVLAPLHLLRAHRGRVVAATGVVLLFVGTMWAWHVPALYNLTLRNEAVHDLEHTTFLVAGLVFWTVALPRHGSLHAVGTIGRSVVVLSGLVGSWMLAVYIGYATGVLYDYAGSGGLSALADQQLAAGVMWVPASLPFVVVLTALVARWLEDDARAAAVVGG